MYVRPILDWYLVPLKFVIQRSSLVVLHDGQYISKDLWRFDFQSSVNLVPLCSGVEPSGAAGAVQSSCTVWQSARSGSKSMAKM